MQVVERRYQLADGDFKQGFDDLEEAGQHLGRGEVLFDFLLAEGVARFLELFADVGVVPGLEFGQVQLAGGKGAQVGDVFFGIGAGAAREVAQKVTTSSGDWAILATTDTSPKLR